MIKLRHNLCLTQMMSADASRPKGNSRERLSSIINGNDVIYNTSPIQPEVCAGAKSQLEIGLIVNELRPDWL